MVVKQRARTLHPKFEGEATESILRGVESCSEFMGKIDCLEIIPEYDLDYLERGLDCAYKSLEYNLKYLLNKEGVSVDTLSGIGHKNKELWDRLNCVCSESRKKRIKEGLIEWWGDDGGLDSFIFTLEEYDPVANDFRYSGWKRNGDIGGLRSLGRDRIEKKDVLNFILLLGSAYIIYSEEYANGSHVIHEIHFSEDENFLGFLPTKESKAFDSLPDKLNSLYQCIKRSNRF